MLDELKAKFKSLLKWHTTIIGSKKTLLENPLKGAYTQVQMAVNDFRNAKDAAKKQTAGAALQTRVQAWNTAYNAAPDTQKQQYKAQNDNVGKVAQQLAQTKTAAPTPTAAGAGNGLSGSVGRDGDNVEADVRQVQELLKKHGYNVDVDGIIGDQTITAIEQFQQAKLGEHDGIIQPNKGTWKALNEAPSNPAPANGDTNSNAQTPATGTSALLSSIQVTGAGKATASQDGLQNKGLTGVQVSQTMAKTDEARIGRYKDLFVKVGKEQGVPAGILAALASRETRGNDMIGDGGNGIGIIQVDKRYHPDKVAKILAKQGAERIEESIRQGAIVFKTSWEQIKQKFPNWTPAQQLKGALAAYNAGVSTVQTFENMDKGTTGDDYSSDVWARAQYFMAQGFSEGEATTPPNQTAPNQDTTQPATNANTLSGSVGRDGNNAEADVRKVQELLKKHGYDIDADGIIGNQTITAIEQFQQAKLGEHDGIIQPDKGTWKALLAAPSQNNNTPQPEQEPDTTGGSYSYYTHPNYTSVNLTYDGKTAYKLNTAADCLIRSALAKAGIFSATITSTKRTYADQARIMKEEVTLAQVAEWYGSDVADAVRSNDKASLEQWIRQNRPHISNHLSGIALDVVVSDRSAYKKVMNELVPMKGSGVKYHLPENHGVEHTEFTFPVTNIKD